jgi:hypothetical protein
MLQSIRGSGLEKDVLVQNLKPPPFGVYRWIQIMDGDVPAILQPKIVIHGAQVKLLPGKCMLVVVTIISPHQGIVALRGSNK